MLGTHTETHTALGKCHSDTAILIFSVQTKLVNPKAMEPLTPVALRGPVPIPPQRTKVANSVSSAINPPKPTSALRPNVINSVMANSTKPGNQEKSRIFLYVVSDNLIHLFDSPDPVQTLASDFGFEDNFNHSLKVEEKKNNQNRIAPPRQNPPIPPLPPRKAPYVPSNPPLAAKERAVPIQANTFTPNTKPEWVHHRRRCPLSKIFLC